MLTNKRKLSSILCLSFIATTLVTTNVCAAELNTDSNVAILQNGTDNQISINSLTGQVGPIAGYIKGKTVIEVAPKILQKVQ